MTPNAARTFTAAAAAAACNPAAVFHMGNLQYLRAIGSAAAPYGPQVVFYLAAAVSDFYVPWSQLVSFAMQRTHACVQTYTSACGVAHKLQGMQLLVRVLAVLLQL
jgi:hypothetical protein